MFEIYRVADVEEAVTLATKFKDEGKYDWFRGQVQDWVPHSSLYRARQNEDIKSQVELNFYLFIEWAQKKSELRYLLEANNRHQLEAILQHYGFPTDYIDFTTEPSIAGFFACDTKTPPEEGNSCIYCLDVDDLLSFWEVLGKMEERKGGKIEKVVVDVSNLWRLQAQRGVFLVANYNWEIDYPLDKIIFPYTGYPSYPTMDIVYPEHKSPLEILLDEFFDKQKSTNFYLKYASHFDTIQRLTPFPNGLYEEAFKNPAEIKILPSWSDENLSNWLSYIVEDYHITSGIYQKLALKKITSEEEIRKVITYGIAQILRSNPSLRNRAVSWILEDAPNSMDVSNASRLLSLVWDGMRLLPYSDEEISLACGNLMFLHTKKIDLLSHDEKVKVFAALFGKGQIVGFSIKEGNGSQAYASNDSLRNALGVDFFDVLSEDMKDRADSPNKLFKVIYNPKMMFDFNKFKTLFATEIIPTQIVFYDTYVIFNPAQIAIFGNP